MIDFVTPGQTWNKNDRKDEEEMVKEILKTVAMLLIALLLTCVGVSGCGKSPAEDKAAPETVGSGTEHGSGGVGIVGGSDEAGGKEGPAAMGRFVETVVDISEQMGRSYGITPLADGSLLILNDKTGRLISKDGGKSWESQPIPGISDLAAFTKENFIFDMAAAPDGSIAVLATPNMEESNAFQAFLQIALADGETRSFKELPVPENEISLHKIAYSPEGELFAMPFGGGVVYQVDLESGALTQYLTAEYSPDILKFQGDYMVCYVLGEGIFLYDRKAKKWVEDETLTDFVKETFPEGNASSEGFASYVAPGEEGVLYLAGKSGLYRHVIGGSAIEQVIDGALTNFSNPSMGLRGMAYFGESAFAALLGGQVSLFAYDATVPTVPESTISVYSLEEQDAVRQAIAQYQTEHPDTFVRYEVGKSGSDGVSTEDAIKKLNTQLMAGKGPDVLILDGLPYQSYAEKGILLDLKPHINSLTGDSVLLPNIVEAFTEGKKTFQMPVRFTLPMVVGRKEDIAQITDYASLAQTTERLRKDHPNAAIGNFFSEEAMMRWFLPVSAPVFLTEDGMDEKALSDYLTQTKRIYDASLEGISEEIKERYDRQKELYKEESWVFQNFNSISQQAEDFLLSDLVLAAGMLKDLYGAQELLSLKYREELSDVEMKPFDGMGSHVFEPAVLVGVNAASAHGEAALAFFDTMMGLPVQSLLYEGFMVNQKALEQQLSPDWAVYQRESRVDYGEVFSVISSVTGDGIELSLDVHMPTREEFQWLYDICRSLDTPYLQDDVIEGALVEIGAVYLKGHLDLEEAVQKILAKVEIYLSE